MVKASILADPDAALTIINLGKIAYERVYRLQQRVANQRASQQVKDQIWFAEHPGIYTAGRRTSPDHITGDIEVFETNRGGSVTWQGPGQLAVYPTVKLANPPQLLRYIRNLEEAVIATCTHFGVVDATRVPFRSGVWFVTETTPDRKIASVGIHLANGVVTGGLSFNCTNSLAPYRKIVPCGLADATQTTLSIEARHLITVSQVRPVLARHLARLLGNSS